jgi:hypothetical protein
MFAFSERSKDRREGVDPRLIEISDLAIQITKVDFGIPSDGGVRTAARQNELYLAGRSKADGVLRKSKHQSGNALDVYAYVDGKASWEVSHMSQVACAMLQAASLLEHKLMWGGHWPNYIDMPHFQLAEELS